MTATALDRLREEIDTAIWDGGINATSRVWLTLTRHIPADVLAGLLDGTMVAVPKEDLMDGCALFTKLILAAAKQEDRA